MSVLLVLFAGCTLAQPELSSQRWQAPGEAQAALAQWNNPDLASSQTPWSTVALRWAATQADTVRAANATLLLLRRGEAVDPVPLQKAVLDTTLTLPMRQAALAGIKALAPERRGQVLASLLRQLNHQAVQGKSGAARLQRDALMALQELLSTEEAPPVAPETIRELVWGSPSKQHPGAIASPDAEVQAIALRVWSVLDEPLPQAGLQLVERADRQVRLALLHAAGNSPELLWQLCQRLLASGDPHLQQEAVRQLGHLAGTAWEQQALQRLQQILQHDGELLRAAAAEALAAWGRSELLARMERDRSWRVRRAVAEGLKRLPPQQARPLALRLLQDISPLVQEAVVESIAAWPPEVSVPVWCRALESNVYSVRAAARERLHKYIPAARAFSLTASLEQRRRLARELLQKWQTDHHRKEGKKTPGDRDVGQALPGPVPDAVGQRLAALLQRDPGAHIAPHDHATWLAALQEHRDVLPLWLEQQLLAGRDIQAALRGEVLEILGGPFRVLARWERASVSERRLLARQLRSLAATKRLGPVVHYVLADRLRREKDPLVWQAALQALGHEESTWAIQIARLGTQHADPEVRRQACLYLRDHPRPEHYPWLAERGQDDQTPVVLAAAEALGRCEHPQAPKALQRLLLAPQGSVQVAAARALARHHPEAGRRALERLCWHRQWQVRRQAALALAELGHRESVPVLLRLLDDVPAVRQAALQGLPRCSQLTPALQVQQQGTAALVHWWKQSLGTATASSPAGSL